MTTGYVSSGWTDEPLYRYGGYSHLVPSWRPARRWHKCRARVRQRKATFSYLEDFVYIDGRFYHSNQELRKLDPHCDWRTRPAWMEQS